MLLYRKLTVSSKDFICSKSEKFKTVALFLSSKICLPFSSDKTEFVESLSLDTCSVEDISSSAVFYINTLPICKCKKKKIASFASRTLKKNVEY